MMTQSSQVDNWNHSDSIALKNQAIKPSACVAKHDKDESNLPVRETSFTVKSPPIPLLNQATRTLVWSLDLSISLLIYALLPRHIHISTILESFQLHVPRIPDNFLVAIFYFGLSTMSRMYSTMFYQHLQLQHMCTVEIMPLGVQIVEFVQSLRHGISVTTKPGNVCFIPHEHIYDVIVSEVILGSSVKSHIMFRIKQDPARGTLADQTCKISGHNLMVDKEIALVPAFPADKILLSLEECLRIWGGMIKVLKEKN